MKTITKDEAKRIVEDYKDSQIFTVTFVKRTTGETRVMNCRKGVVKHLTGGGQKYNPAQKGLVSVYDVDLAKKLKKQGIDGKKAYRSIALESIMRIKMKSKEYEVK